MPALPTAEKYRSNVYERPSSASGRGRPGKLSSQTRSLEPWAPLLTKDAATPVVQSSLGLTSSTEGIWGAAKHFKTMSRVSKGGTSESLHGFT